MSLRVGPTHKPNDESSPPLSQEAEETIADRIVPGVGGEIPGTGGIHAISIMEVIGAVASGLFAVADAIREHTASMQAAPVQTDDDEDDEDEDY